MKHFLYNITGGNPRALLEPCLVSLATGFCQIVPSLLIFAVFDTIYLAHAREQAMHMEKLWGICALLAGWMLVEYAARARAHEKTAMVAYQLSATGRTELAEHLRKLPLGFFGRRDPAALTTMLLNDYSNVETTVSFYVPQLVSAVILPVVVFSIMLLFSPQMALAMFLPLPLCFGIMWLSSGLQKKISGRHVRAREDCAGRLQEYLLGMREIKSHNLSGERFEALREAFARLKRESLRMEIIVVPIVLIAIAALRSGLTLMLLIGTFLLVDGELSLPIFLLFLLLGMRVVEPLSVALVHYAELRYTALSADRIMAIRQEPPLPGTGQAPCGGDIRFDRVSFAYRHTDVLQEVSFLAPAGRVTALVGPSGSGKSTITRLIARFWDVRQGTISLAGHDLATCDPESILARISMVFQDVYLFRDSIGNNIAVGRKNATRREVEEAAKKACCHDFITALPQGYDTQVGEGGCTLSGGEKQRISIARALLKDAPIILLDEATASLDPENEIYVQRAINALVANKTVLIIAHRLRTIRRADWIVVLDHGRVIEQGTHEQLLAENGLYQHLWALQSRTAGWSMRPA
ncbi:ABC transporter ATP-binding protein [Desulfobulbus sp.]|uniref:ABC transporter ATP-binding protein n=1 Tax=Desulfobulbus sp. TaxID=895 RepID=UPI00286F97B1|nr:ABC transporter ATP-binding protein [Desulfobulbus sp.]